MKILSQIRYNFPPIYCKRTPIPVSLWNKTLRDTNKLSKEVGTLCSIWLSQQNGTQGSYRLHKANIYIFFSYRKTILNVCERRVSNFDYRRGTSYSAYWAVLGRGSNDWTLMQYIEPRIATFNLEQLPAK